MVKKVAKVKENFLSKNADKKNAFFVFWDGKISKIFCLLIMREKIYRSAQKRFSSLHIQSQKGGNPNRGRRLNASPFDFQLFQLNLLSAQYL